jgi:mono/diheme cytochrome c family protein
MTRLRRPVPLALAILIGLLVGCGKKPAADNGPGSPEPPGPSASVGPSDAKGLYGQHCAKCHPSGGSAEGGPRKGMKGPDLSQIGSEHDADWIAEHIRHPRGHNPQSRMPQFDGKLKPEEIRALAEHLAAMK